MVIEPLLIDEDYYARVEGREIISNLAKVSNYFLAGNLSDLHKISFLDRFLVLIKTIMVLIIS